MLFDIGELQLFLQVLFAAFLGGLIGLEREYKRKEAGLKTFSLVCLGSCFFTSVAVYLRWHSIFPNSLVKIDPARVIQAIAIGIGFIGSGIIIQRKSQIEGLTTAAALWATGAIGIGVGLKLYFLAILSTFLIVGILSGLRIVETKLVSKYCFYFSKKENE